MSGEFGSSISEGGFEIGEEEGEEADGFEMGDEEEGEKAGVEDGLWGEGSDADELGKDRDVASSD